MADVIAVLNAGSSSLKFSMFAEHRARTVLLVRGHAEGLSTSPRFIAKSAEGVVLEDPAAYVRRVNALIA